MHKWVKRGLIVFLGLAAVVLVATFCFYQGFLQINNPSKTQYPVRGVDVSAYQGQIDWQVLAGQGIDFAFIKATEGSSFVDPQFLVNWEASHDTDLAVGAYHFFSFESSGTRQAEHFISTVPKLTGMLPPVVDLEFYGSFSEAVLTEKQRSEIRSELETMLEQLELYYGVEPVLYVTPESYQFFGVAELNRYPLWFRSVYGKIAPQLDWTFWQYSNRKRLDGYTGPEKFIDLNAFCGTREEFAQMKRVA